MRYIFRKTDKIWLYAAATPEQLENELAACLRNEGGSLKDYVVVTNNDERIPPGTIPELQANNTVKHIGSPEKVARESVRISLAAKLGRLAGLNLSDDELSLLTRG